MARKILIYGDSNTYGYDPAGFPSMRYPEKILWTTLAARELPDWQMLPEGMNGRPLPDLPRDAAAIERLIRKIEPDGIFAVMLGTNDLLFSMEPDAERAVRKMDRLLDCLTGKIEAGRILVIAPARIASDEMRDPLYHQYYEESERLAEGFRKLAEQRGTHFADAGKWNISLAADLVHFSEEGHRRFADGLTAYLTAEFGKENAMEFRTLTRFKQQIPEEECIEILKETKRGVLAVLGDGDYPYAVPHNHYYREADGKIYFHSGKFGHKVDAIRRHDKVSYCVCDDGTQEEDSWVLRFRSVIVFGRIEIIEDTETIYQIARELSYKFTKDDAYIDDEIRRSGARTMLFALVPENIIGKRVREA